MTPGKDAPKLTIEHLLTLAERFARDAREGGALAKCVKDSAAGPTIEAPTPGAIAAIRNGRMIDAQPSAQSQLHAKADAMHNAAKQNVLNLIAAARDLGALIGFTVTIEPANGQK